MCPFTYSLSDLPGYSFTIVTNGLMKSDEGFIRQRGDENVYGKVEGFCGQEERWKTWGRVGSLSSIRRRGEVSRRPRVVT